MDTHSSRPMMRELQRWTSPTRVKVVPPRWPEWARAMIGRHRPVIDAGGAWAMTFVQPARLIQLHGRLINFSLNVCSRMNLAIQPILREIRVGEERASRARGVQPDGSRSYLRGDADTTPLQSTGLAGETGALWPPTFAGQGSAESSGKTRTTQAGTSRPAASTAGDYSSSKIGGLPPEVSLVFRRLHLLDDFAGSRDRETTEDASRHALHLVRQLKRVEQPMPASAPQVARRGPAAASTQQAAPQLISTEQTGQQTLGMFRAQEPSWRANAAQMPDAILEQLTERVIRQIDQRTIAWRERMGKT